MKICVLGLGHIGLPTAAMFAQAGFDVIGYDTDAAVRRNIRSGCASISDSQVRVVAADALKIGRFRVADDLEIADAFIICVPTPTHERKPDLRYITQSAEAIAPLLRDGDLIVLESTVPPGTTERIIAGAIRGSGRDPDTMRIAHAPERVIPGNIVTELKHNARIIGGRRPGDAEAASRLYASFVSGQIHLTDCRTAELVKVIENTYRDINIAYANELALLAEELGVDAWEAIRLANDHPRVNILSPGPGVGGHCIPVDPHFLSNANPFVTELIQTARRINERMPHIVMRRIEQLIGNALPAKVALLGAAYKANVDDTRESPSAVICSLLE
ncbi:MAG: nucleotide sugar dehydrogenase, partial [Candidatus Eremiobacteraeota bacterium]|nr:nucleotide sugar dehydrogenase [Candidatus Eremiobacteraeota bacterium]